MKLQASAWLPGPALPALLTPAAHLSLGASQDLGHGTPEAQCLNRCACASQTIQEWEQDQLHHNFTDACTPVHTHAPCAHCIAKCTLLQFPWLFSPNPWPGSYNLGHVPPRALRVRSTSLSVPASQSHCHFPVPPQISPPKAKVGRVIPIDTQI